MPHNIQTSALGTLIILQIVMLFSLYFRTPPYPPETIPIGGLAPTIGASLSVAVTALLLRGEGVLGKALIIFACLLAAISFGPQKYFDPAFSLVWPAVVTAQISIATLLTMIGISIFQKSKSR